MHNPIAAALRNANLKPRRVRPRKGKRAYKRKDRTPPPTAF